MQPKSAGLPRGRRTFSNSGLGISGMGQYLADSSRTRQVRFAPNNRRRSDGAKSTLGANKRSRDDPLEPTFRASRRHQGFIHQHHGGAVLCIEGSSDMERIQAASCGRPVVRSPKLRLRATSRATARINCAIFGVPCIKGSASRPSNTSAIRWARATSCAKTVGERSPAGRAISRSHIQIPSHMLRAANSSRW